MTSVLWDGVIDSRALDEFERKNRCAIADAGREGNWDRLFDLLDAHPKHINSVRPDGLALYSPLHQAAWHGARPDIANRLIKMGAWRTLPNANGERAVDIARKRHHHQLLESLSP